MAQETVSTESQQKKKKRLLGSRLRYTLYLAAWIVFIAVAFNLYFTFKFHKEFVNGDKGWPWLRYHETIGYQSQPDFEEQWDTYYHRTHELGYRIRKGQSASEVVPGGILAVGGSFTFGDAVESEQAFPSVAADALGLPAYNFGLGSYSYASVLLQLRDLEERGVIDKLAPSIILLGAGNWLVHRSLSPIFPTHGLSFGYAYIGRRGDGLVVLPPPSFYSIDNLWKLTDRYYPQGTGVTDTSLTFSRFAMMFAHTPRVLAARLAQRFRYQPFHSDISSEELYRFVIGEIDAAAQKHGAQVVVLWMPLFQLELDLGLSRSLKLEHVLVDGGEAIVKHGLGTAEYFDRHPTVPAHAAYGAMIVEELQDHRNRRR